MTRDRAFEFGIALLNSLGFVCSTGMPTFVDGRLTSHIIYGARHYPLGYWVCLPAPVIGALTYMCLQKCKSARAKVVLPTAILVGAGVLTLPNFRPGFIPHMAVTLGITLCAVASLASCWIRFGSTSTEYLKEAAIPWELILLC